MKFESVYDLAQHYHNLIVELPYPAKSNIPQKPDRKDFLNNQSFGKALDEWEEIEKKEKGDYIEKLREYRTEVSKIESDFKTELLKYLGISKSKKADKLYEIAWDMGHSSGYGEVAMEAERLAELIK